MGRLAGAGFAASGGFRVSFAVFLAAVSSLVFAGVSACLAAFFAVVFLVVLKNAVNWIYGVIGIVLFSVLIMLGFKFYKRIREKNSRQ